MEAYLRYNQINIDPLDVLKTGFMSNHDNYYNVTSFGLKNVGSTYQ